ncbi:MAG TPA: bifunctional 2-C-methyl-D-erythritol 4-phosphate cytidylyltransferase/2-C-methyl-D-erythritol 2,4-cyclodiphosphate synthase [Methylomirabilota bacterium]|nr:bifunctional 2-C-methyl-D-erythritol 4-phosphate cytidylyltransferase/2-C-methyl-D-erythritol 2,4-cyclodiphosphate synthase [Methylomirabilota bacterium]
MPEPDQPTLLSAGGLRPKVAVVLVAGGRGTRARRGGADDAVPKQYRPLAGRSILARTIDAFLAHDAVDAIVTAIHPDDAALYRRAVADVRGDRSRVRPPVAGGADRQASVLAGLEALVDEAPDLVLIHDAVRPFVTSATIGAAVAALAEDVAVVVGVPVVDSVARADRTGIVVGAIPREGLWRAATPQGFRYNIILDAHRRAVADGVHGLTDDGAVAVRAGRPVRMIATEETNVKLTTPEDIAAAEARLAAAAFLRLPDVRTGIGYDVHALEPGDGLVLCGVAIPHTHRLKGHSDADVALHALTDALLGAIGDGDIGQHFPPSEPEWRGVASRVFLEDAMRRLRARGGVVAQVDVTIVAEAPKIGPHRDAMRGFVADVCGVSLDRVGVKATTNEGIGFAGRREGIAALASATVRLPPPGAGETFDEDRP